MYLDLLNVVDVRQRISRKVLYNLVLYNLVWYRKFLEYCCFSVKLGRQFVDPFFGPQFLPLPTSKDVALGPAKNFGNVGMPGDMSENLPVSLNSRLIYVYFYYIYIYI